jgi:hypothetical protein
MSAWRYCPSADVVIVGLANSGGETDANDQKKAWEETAFGSGTAVGTLETAALPAGK